MKSINKEIKQGIKILEQIFKVKGQMELNFKMMDKLF